MESYIKRPYDVHREQRIGPESSVELIGSD